jgi:hypothetical protein
MVRANYVDVDVLPRMKKPWWFGYGGNLAPQMESFLDMLFARPLRQKALAALRSSSSLWRKKL